MTAVNSGPPLSDIVDGTLLLRTRHNGRQARVADQLAHELQHNMLTVEAGIEACLLGVPYHRGKEAEDAGHTRILIDISALPYEFLTSIGAHTWCDFKRLCSLTPGVYNVVVQVMCRAAARTTLQPHVLLFHSDPHASSSKVPGKSCEVLLSLPGSGRHHFSLAKVPPQSQLFSAAGFAHKFDFKEVCDLQQYARPAYESHALDDHLLGGHVCDHKGYPIVHTGNPMSGSCNVQLPSPLPTSPTHPPPPLHSV